MSVKCLNVGMFNLYRLQQVATVQGKLGLVGVAANSNPSPCEAVWRFKRDEEGVVTDEARMAYPEFEAPISLTVN